jgi:TonB family protein
MRRKLPFSLAALIFLALASCRTEPPKVVQAVAPNYLQVARLAHVEGVIVVAVGIGPNGKVSNAKVRSGPALILLRQECLTTARKWLFAASSKQTRSANLSFEFVIDDALDKDALPEVSFSPPYNVAIRVAPIYVESSAAAVRVPRN